MAHEAPLDNPAGRLHRILVGVTSANEAEQVDRVLQRLFGLEDEKDEASRVALLLRQVAELATLAQQAQAQIETLVDVNHELFLRWVSKVNKALMWAPRWNENINNMKQLLDSTTLYSLEMCADMLHRMSPEPTIEDDKLSELVELVRAAIDATAEMSALPAEVRQSLIARLREVEISFIYFRTTGYPGVETAMDALTGTWARQPTAHSSEATGWLQKLWAKLSLSVRGVQELSEGVGSAAKAIEAVQNTLP